MKKNHCFHRLMVMLVMFFVQILLRVAAGDVIQSNIIRFDIDEVALFISATQYDLNKYSIDNSATWHGPLEIAADCTIKNGTIRNNSLTGDALVTITGGNVVFEDVTFDCSGCSPQALIRIAFGSKANVTFKGNCRFLAANKNVDAIYVDYCASGKVMFDNSFTGHVGGKVTLAYESTHPNDDPAVEVSIAGSGTFENAIALDGGTYAFRNSSVSISGGRFAVEPDSSCLASGLCKASGTSGYWSILPRSVCELALAKAGWHLVSFNVLPDDPSPAVVFANVADKIDRVVQGSKVWRPSAGGRLTEVQIGVGYWVRTTVDNVSWSVEGCPNPCVEIPLSKGWNLVGYPLSESGATATVLKTALDSGKVTKIVNGTKAYPGRLTELSPGVGYWFYAPAACTITFEFE